MARPPTQVDLDLHAAAMAAIDSQAAGLGNHHAIGADAVLLENVEPRQAVAILLLHRADHPDGAAARQAQFPDELARVDHARHAGALIASTAAVHVAVLHFAHVGVPGPFARVAHAHGIGVGIHHDDGLARSDPAQDVAHRIDAHLVETHLLHLLPDARDHRALVAAFGGDSDQVAQKADHLRLVALRQLSDAMAIGRGERGVVHRAAGASSVCAS